MKTKNLLLFAAAGTMLSASAIDVIIDHESEAAEADFRYHLSKMRAQTSTLKVAEHPYKVQSQTNEAYRLKITGDKAYVSGNSAVAVGHGLYELLERMGCDWIMPGEIGEVIPECADPKPADCDIEESPSFVVRDPWYSGGTMAVSDHEYREFHQWGVRKKLRGSRHPLEMQGGHMWDAIIGQYADIINEHPEYLALCRNHDGTFSRRGPQLDTSNPEVVKLFERYIREAFENNNWPKDKPVTLGIGPADGGGFSESPEALAEGSGRIDPMTGELDQTDSLVLLCNRIIDDIGDEFPNLHLGWYLYSVHADFPMKYKPNPRIVIVIADISYSRFHATVDPVSTRIYYRQLIEKWAETPNLKFFRGYNWNLAENFLPYSKLDIWAHEYPFYHKMNVQGSTTECEMSWATTGPGNYYEAELLWDVTSDMDETLTKYCNHAFGKGAKYMKEYYLAINERQRVSGQEAGGIFSMHRIYDHDFVKYGMNLFAKALAAAERPEEKERITYMRKPLEGLEDFLNMRELQFDCRFKEADDLLLKILNDRQTLHDEKRHWNCWYSIMMLEWYYRRPLEDSVKYSTGDYKLLYKIPNKLPTVFDPFKRGIDLGYNNPYLNDSKWIKTETFESNWSEQGLSGLAVGSCWYRVHVPADAIPADQPIGLLVGGCDSIARVYCNGGYVGEGIGWASAFAFDLTDFVKPGEENVIAIEIQRNGVAELGTGGITFPSFLFTGPRLEQRAPAFDESLLKILPGGARAD